jgi:hypothetical protein
MEPRRAAAELTLPLAAVLLVVFLAGGVGAGALARSFVNSLGAAPPKATATASMVAERVTPTTAPQTASPTQAASDQNFDLQISATPSQVSPGGTIKINVMATSSGKPLAGLSCALAAPRSGPPGLLSTWPAAQTTDASGATSWMIVAPGSQPSGTYGVEVSASVARHTVWKLVYIQVA